MGTRSTRISKVDNIGQSRRGPRRGNHGQSPRSSGTTFSATRRSAHPHCGGPHPAILLQLKVTVERRRCFTRGISPSPTPQRTCSRR